MNTQCEMTKDCANPVTHIGEKGYVYCAEHAQCRQGASARTRRDQMRARQPAEAGAVSPAACSNTPQHLPERG